MSGSFVFEKLLLIRQIWSSSDSNESGGSYRALFFAILASFVCVLDQTIVTIAVPTLIKHFDVPLKNMQLVVSGQVLMLSLAVPLSSWFNDCFGKGRTYIYSLSCVLLCNLAAGLASSYEILIVARLFQGFSSGILIPTTMALVIAAFPEEKRGAAIGLWITGATVALIVGPVVGGLLIDGPGWRFAFLVGIPIGIVAIVLGYISTKKRPEAKTNGRPFDWRGYFFLATAIASLLLSLDGQRFFGFSSHLIFTLYFVSAATLLAFCFHIFHTEDALLPGKLFKNRHFLIGFALTAQRAFLLFSGGFLMSIFLQNLLQYSPRDTGLILLPSAILTVSISSYIGKLADRIAPKYLLYIGMVALAIGSFGYSFEAVRSSTVLIILMTLTRALGICCLATPTVKIAFTSLSSEEQNVGSSGLYLSQRIAAGVGVALVGKFLGLLGETPEAFTKIFLFMAFASLLGIPAVHFLLKSKKPEQHPV